MNVYYRRQIDEKKANMDLKIIKPDVLIEEKPVPKVPDVSKREVPVVPVNNVNKEPVSAPVAVVKKEEPRRVEIDSVAKKE